LEPQELSLVPLFCHALFIFSDFLFSACRIF
jgi:hypothetical protein